MRIILLLVLGYTMALQGATASGNDAYKFLNEIQIGGEGGWDILTVDAGARRLYLSHATKIVVIDLEKNAVVGEIADTPGVHGFMAVPDLQRGFSSNGKEAKASVVDLKTLVGDEENNHVAGGAGAVLHGFAFGKPDEMAWPERPFVRDELAFEDKHAVAAGVRVQWIDDAGRIADDTNLHAAVGIGVKVLAKQRAAELLVEALFPGLLRGVDGEKFVGLHGVVVRHEIT